MHKRATLSLSAALIGTLTLGLPALAAEPNAAAPAAAAPEHPASAKKTASQPAPPRRAAADDPYRCHPSEDISCTVVRETAQGTLIVTVRPRGRSGPTPAWMVVSGAPPLPGPHPGGTVYVVPAAASDAEPLPHQAALMSPNAAPILD